MSDEFLENIEGSEDYIISEEKEEKENENEITKEGGEQEEKKDGEEENHWEETNNLEDLNRVKRSADTMENTTSSSDSHNFYKLLKFIQNEGVEGEQRATNALKADMV